MIKLNNVLGLILLLFVTVASRACNNIRHQKKINKSSEQKAPNILKDKPNIIIILLDDAGYADFGFMGSKEIQTPNIDMLSRNGVIFTNAYVTASVCSPSRAGLLTGRYQQRFGHECNLTPNQPLAFDSAEVTIAEALKIRDYKTGIIGKWHLGEKIHQHPLNNGFDYFWGFISGERSYFPGHNEVKNPKSQTIMENRNYTNFDGYLTDVLGDKAVEFINKNNEEDPFFLYLAFNAPHAPMEAKLDVMKKFEGHPRQKLAAMMWSMDEALGKVIATLKEKKIYDNTLIFFLSDNGGALTNQSSVAPLKGWKGNQFEGGIRIPFTVTWKNKIQGGIVYDGLTSSLDIYKTAISVAGMKGSPGKPLDGKDIFAALIKKDPESFHKELYWRKDQMATIRSGEYKLIKLKGGQSVLYNINTDLQEINDLSKFNPELKDSLDKNLQNWERELKSPIWLEPKVWNKVTHIIYEDLMKNKTPRAKHPSDLTNLK
ncbi:MAG: sulfatase-like hydrolase/transferase [Segetibacter sp.]